jgi:hypothetical protein
MAYFTRFCVLDLDLKIESSQTGPYFLQTGSWNENCNHNVVPGAMLVDRARFRRGEGSVRSGKCEGGTRDHLGFDSEGRLWRRSDQRRCSAAPWISSRLCFCSGNLVGRGGKLVAREGAGVLVEVVVSSEGDGEA